MDQLYQLFAATFNGDPNVRMSGELELRKIEGQEGVPLTSLRIAASSEADPAVRQAAAVYLKNRIRSSWRIGPNDRLPSTSSIPIVPIGAQDRLSIKDEILLAIVKSPSKVVVQLREALSTIVTHDFPEQWENLLERTVVLLNSADPAELVGGLVALAEIMKVYRTEGKNRDHENAIIAQTFPILLNLGTNLMKTQQSDAQTGMMLHLILKSYKYSIRWHLSPHQQAHGQPGSNGENSLAPWGMLLLSVVGRNIPAELQPQDTEEREKWSWWRAKKAAYHILLKLYSEYGCPSHLPPNRREDYASFAKFFEPTYAPEILKIYIRQIEEYVESRTWLAPKCLAHIFEFLEQCIKPKTMWQLLQPHVEVLVTRFAFPTLCLPDDEVELFKDDPAAFCRDHLGFFGAKVSVTSEAATGFLLNLAACRRKTLGPVIQFVQTVLSSYPAQSTAQQRDGALKMLSVLSSVIEEEPTAAESVKGILEHHIMPDFRSEHGILRFRACNVVEQFEGFSLGWETEEIWIALFNALCQCLLDPELPVRAQAAVSLFFLVGLDEVRAHVGPNVERIMQELIKLSRELDIDSLTRTMNEMVKLYPAEVTPFASALAEQLVATYVRLLQENADNTSSDDSPESADRVTTALEVLHTLDSLVVTMEDNKALVAQIEAVAVPSLLGTLQHEFLEYYEDVCGLIANFIFHQRKVSDPMWQMFAALHATFKSGGADHFDLMYQPINYFVRFGADRFKADPVACQMLVDFFTSAMASDRLGANDRGTACKIAESTLLHLRGYFDQVIPVYIQQSIHLMQRKGSRDQPVVTHALFMHALELILSSILYNTDLTLTLLEQAGFTETFMREWFSSRESFTRLHDKKMAIAAISSILARLSTLSPQDLQTSTLAKFSKDFIVRALDWFQDLPLAAVERRDMERAVDDDSDDDISSEDEDEIQEVVENMAEDVAKEHFKSESLDEEEGEDKDVYDQMDKFREKFALREQDDSDDEDDEEVWSIEILHDAPLDGIDVYELFDAALAEVQKNPTLQQMSVGRVPDNLRNDLQSVLKQAKIGGEKLLIEELEPIGPIS